MIKLYPEDRNKNFGSLAIKLPMNSSKFYNRSEIFNLSYTTEEQAVSNYINLLMTKKGERYMQPNLGVGLNYYLFEQNSDDVRRQLEEEIRTQAELWLPYIFNESITIIDYNGPNISSGNGINIIIRFRVTESGANKTISIFPGIDGNTADVEIS